MTQMTPKEIIDLAITREEEAAAFYRHVADLQKSERVKQLFLDYAAEEDRHKQILEELDISDVEKIEVKKVADLKVGDHMSEKDPTGSMDYGDALVLGMQKEKKAYRLYMGLADSTDDAAIKNLFLKLAMEEAKHKLWFETQYDDYILLEN